MRKSDNDIAGRLIFHDLGIPFAMMQDLINVLKMRTNDSEADPLVHLMEAIVTDFTTLTGQQLSILTRVVLRQLQTSEISRLINKTPDHSFVLF
jgi:hypothetical protein